jgi:hypothetical protein
MGCKVATIRATFRPWGGVSMCVSRTLSLAAAAWLVAGAAVSRAADAGRLDLLASEAKAMTDQVAAAPAGVGHLGLVAIPLATMLAAFIGTWLGIRGLSFGSLRHKDGWREVAYRFRSDEPLTLGKDVIRRMRGVLDDIEDLGKRMRTRSASPEPAAVTDPWPAAPAPAPARVAPAPVATVPVAPVPAAPPAPRPEVTFARRDETHAAPASNASGAFRMPSASGESGPWSGDAAPAAAAPRPIARSSARAGDRGTRYRRARALLREGHDRETVRSMTGLKLAELDLLRCAGAGNGEGA